MNQMTIKKARLWDLIRNNLPLLLILTLFTVTRLYKISSLPASVYWDEASIAYNAYSVAETGLDEWGNRLPLYFKAFGEYKLPVYVYTVTLFAKIFGISTLALRLPSVVYFFIANIALYLLASKFFNNKVQSLFSVLLFSTSSWGFIFSRSGYEVSAGLAFYLLGLLLLLPQKTKESYWRLALGVLFFALSIYSYNSFVVFTPITLCLLLVYRLFNNGKLSVLKFKSALLLMLVFIGLTYPAYNFAVSSDNSRYRTSSILFEGDKKLATLKKVAVNYLAATNPSYLFIVGDGNPRSQIPFSPQINVIEAVLLLFGIIGIAKARDKKYLLLLALFVFAFLPTALTKEPQNALRSLPVTPSLALIEALGFGFILKLAKPTARKAVTLSAVCLLLLFYVVYLNKFFSSYNTLSAEGWQWAYKDMYAKYGEKFNDFDNVVVSDRYGQPYIFVLYYSGYDPELFRDSVQYNQTGRFATSTVASFNNFIFTNINYYEFPGGKSLIFAHPSEKMTEITEKESVFFPNGDLAYIVYEFKK